MDLPQSKRLPTKSGDLRGTDRPSALKRSTAILWRQPPWAIALAIVAPLAFAYLIIAPASADLAAASYRSYLFARYGLTVWDNGWYGGHHLLAYSLLSPALGAPLGPRLPQAISAVFAAVLFAQLIQGRFAARATRIASAWFALGAGVELLSGRVPFDLGLAIGLGALLAAQRGLRATALTLALLCSLASPVAGAFLALGCLAWAIGAPSARPGRLHIRRIYASSASRFIESRGREAAPVGRLFRLSLGGSALLVIGLATLFFPEGGSEPFVASAFLPALAGVLVVGALLGPDQRVLRTGALLYGGALIGAFLIPTAVGGNAVRLGALVAGPLAACTLSQRRGRFLLVLAPLLCYWQLVAPVRDLISAASDPAVNASYYTPLLNRLRTLGALGSEHPTRIEVVPTRDHWEARWMAPQIALARGWERQLDHADNPLFYSSQTLTARRYHSWLAQNAIAYVALPDAPLDTSGRAEARLLRTGEESQPASNDKQRGAGRPSYLREVWRSAHWRLFAVVGAQPLAQPPAVIQSMGSDSFTLMVPHPGLFTVRVRYTPYWALESSSGCVQRGPGDWTTVDSRKAGLIHIGIDFSLQRVFTHGPRCR